MRAAPPDRPMRPDDDLLRWWWGRSQESTGERLTAPNRTITSLAGALLIPLLGVVFLTGVAMDMFWHVHYAVGFLLIPIVVLKLASTGYRAASYYLGRPTYRAAGPPELPLRLLAPVIVVSTATALATGVALWLQHSRSGTLATLHTDSAVICAGTLGIHLLAYVPRALTGTAAALRSRRGRVALALVAVTLLAGIAVTVVTYAGGTWPQRQQRGSLER